MFKAGLEVSPQQHNLQYAAPRCDLVCTVCGFVDWRFRTLSVIPARTPERDPNLTRAGLGPHMFHVWLEWSPNGHGVASELPPAFSDASIACSCPHVRQKRNKSKARPVSAIHRPVSALLIQADADSAVRRSAVHFTSVVSYQVDLQLTSFIVGTCSRHKALIPNFNLPVSFPCQPCCVYSTRLFIHKYYVIQ